MISKHYVSLFIDKVLDLYISTFKGNIDLVLDNIRTLDMEYFYRYDYKGITKILFKIFNKYYDSIDEKWSKPIEDIKEECIGDIIMEEVRIIKVSKTTPVKSLASSIVKEVENYAIARIRAIGPSSISQALKGYIISKSIIASKRSPFTIDFFFEDIDIKGEQITSIKMVIK